MPGRWEFVDADPDERRRFASREDVFALAHEPAAPKNRRRRVFRVTDQGREWFFKEFGRTQWKNRWRFATTLPHASDDAERETLVTRALRAAGIEAPRPLLHGRDERGSYYLCARLPGTPLRELLWRGELTGSLARMLAGFLGDVLRKGFWLPDLSAEHVHVRKEIAFYHFGLLDLHNGVLGPPGPPPRRLCRRVLRHFARSVEDLPVTRVVALRFAVRLLRSAGRGEDVRALLRSLPPFDTAARYERRGKSKAYADRDPLRTERELDLLAKVWPGRPGELVLDAPSGAGRLLPFLRARGHRVLWLDGARAMLDEARRLQAGAPSMLQGDALRLPLLPQSVDGLVQFRFLHHLSPSRQKLAIAETCRVARRFVVVSFFHPCSVHHARRRLRDLVLRRAPTRFAVTTSALQRRFAAHGFRLHEAVAELAYAKDLWVAAFVREVEPAPGPPPRSDTGTAGAAGAAALASPAAVESDPAR